MTSKRGVLVFVAVMALVLTGCAEKKTHHPISNSAAPLSQDNPPGAWDPVPNQPLVEPDQLYSSGGTLNAVLDAKNRQIMVSGSKLNARPWGNNINGPTLHVKPGETINVKFKNKMGEHTNIHYHGFHVSPLGDSDNIFRSFDPNSDNQSSVTLPPTHAPGTFWYHVHPHGISEGQVRGGLSGLIEVEGLKDRLPPDLRGVTERQLAMRDVKTRGNSIVLDPQDNSGTQTTTVLTDGQLRPTWSIAQGETQLWHLANIGADLFYDVQLPGHQFHVIAEDADPVWEVWSADHLSMPPGKRYDVLVQGGAPGTYQFQSLQNNGPQPSNQASLGTVTVTPAGTQPAQLPTTMETPEQKAHEDLTNATIDTPPADRQFTFLFAQNDEPFGQGSLIAWAGHTPDTGVYFDVNRMPVGVKLGSTEEWTIYNKTLGPHPFHIHVNDFQVMSVNDQPYNAKGLQDVMTIPPRVGDTPGKVVIRQRYDDFPGWFVFHCHILNHEDDGMMMTVQVLKPGENPSPPPHTSAMVHMDESG